MSGEIELKVGRTYRAKRPAVAGWVHEPLINDRTLVHIGLEYVQYDGPSVAFGRRYPRMTIESFRKWAARDVTEELPKGEYAPWPSAKATEGPAP